MVNIYFGLPGCGKSSHAAMIVQRNLKHHIKTFCNFPCEGAIQIYSSYIGKYSISDGDLIIDEAGIDFNSRAYKAMQKNTIQWLKLYRHFHIRNIYVYSQSFDDMDVTIRRLADRLYLMEKTFVPKLTRIRRIRKVIGVDDVSKQIIDQYSIDKLCRSYLFTPLYWKHFDSFAVPSLPPLPPSLSEANTVDSPVIQGS